MSCKVAFFVSAHGFGHAARAVSIMDKLREIRPDVSFEIFGAVPSWFFDESLGGGFRQRFIETDVGLVQTGPLAEDLPATVEKLDAFYPLSEERLTEAMTALDRSASSLCVCDISPLGLAAARRVGIRSVLVENFTWDWIYEGYLGSEPAFAPFIEYLRGLFSEADYHIQTEPICERTPCDLIVPPVSRAIRNDPSAVREALGIAPDQRMALLTMGGIPDSYPYLDALSRCDELVFVAPGSHAAGRDGNVIRIAHHSGLYHPDLINSADVVVGKLGYSTLAEVYQAGVPHLFVKRARFRETERLAVFAENELGAKGIGEEELNGGDWVEMASDLSKRQRAAVARPNGALRAARFIADLL